MTNTTNDGGQAFPCIDSDSSGQMHLRDGGMTLRDYFAAKAMQSMLESSEADDFRESEWGQLTLPEISEQAYRMADFMLAAREVTP